MLSVEGYAYLVNELLVLEDQLEKLGNVVIGTSQGPYAMREQALSEAVPEQKAYDDLLRVVTKKRNGLAAIDRVVQYTLAKEKR